MTVFVASKPVVIQHFGHWPAQGRIPLSLGNAEAIWSLLQQDAGDIAPGEPTLPSYRSTDENRQEVAPVPTVEQIIKTEGKRLEVEASKLILYGTFDATKHASPIAQIAAGRLARRIAERDAKLARQQAALDQCMQWPATQAARRREQAAALLAQAEQLDQQAKLSAEELCLSDAQRAYKIACDTAETFADAKDPRATETLKKAEAAEQALVKAQAAHDRYVARKSVDPVLATLDHLADINDKRLTADVERLRVRMLAAFSAEQYNEATELAAEISAAIAGDSHTGAALGFAG